MKRHQVPSLNQSHFQEPLHTKDWHRILGKFHTQEAFLTVPTAVQAHDRLPFPSWLQIGTPAQSRWMLQIHVILGNEEEGISASVAVALLLRLSEVIKVYIYELSFHLTFTRGSWRWCIIHQFSASTGGNFHFSMFWIALASSKMSYQGIAFLPSNMYEILSSFQCDVRQVNCFQEPVLWTRQ